MGSVEPCVINYCVMILLSVINYCITYLLSACGSESSMFVTKDRFILKTCGTTTLLHAVDYLINLVKEKVGYDIVLVRNHQCGYSVGGVLYLLLLRFSDISIIVAVNLHNYRLLCLTLFNFKLNV